MLEGRNVALGVTGSIAAVKGVELAHELRRAGASVRAITTPAAESIIHPWSLEFATGSSAITELTGAVEHIELCGENGWADVLLIAPATANTIGKMAAAIDDTPVTTCATTALGSDLPIVIAPAMHEPMWNHPGVLDAIEKLENWGVHIVPPTIEEEKAKLPEVDRFVPPVARASGTIPLEDQQLIITSGATQESIDPVRVLTNRSSGRMGRALARAAYASGATVTLVHSGPSVPFVENVLVETTDEMRDAVLDRLDTADGFVSSAAIGDFTVESAPDKLDSRQTHRLELHPAPKLIEAAREMRPDLPIVGFKAEHSTDDEQLVTAARQQLNRIDAAFVVANDAEVMGAEETRVLLVDDSDSEVVVGSKTTVAVRIIERLSTFLKDSGERNSFAESRSHPE